MVREDIDSFLKYGTVRHGEWFTAGERLPGGDHRHPLPSGLRDAPRRPPSFPEMEASRDKFDGCPNQFSYGTNFHQIGEWLSKTMQWHPLAVAAAAAEASDACAAAATAEVAADDAQVVAAAAAASCDDTTAAAEYSAATDAAVTATRLRAAAVCANAAAAAIAAAPGGIHRSGNKLVEYHGKGSCDGYSNVPSLTLKHAIESGALIAPGTHELVLYMAEHKQVHSFLVWQMRSCFLTLPYTAGVRLPYTAGAPLPYMAGAVNPKGEKEWLGVCGPVLLGLS